MPPATNRLFRLLDRIHQSIAFYPALIASAHLLFGIALLAFEGSSLADRLRPALPAGLGDPDNVREILGTLITAVVSLMVFSFSMVMVVLNGAAARLSPRVLPQLISDRRNSVILGAYLGNILYLLLMISQVNTSQPSSIPSFGALLALLAGLNSMVLFVVFIRSVSQSIQPDWVVRQLYREATDALDTRVARLGELQLPPDDSDWWCLRARQPGYLRRVNERQLGQLLRKHDLLAVIQVEPGFFLVEGHPLIKLSRPLQAEQCNALLSCFDFHDDEFARSNVSFAMRQMTEVAVKAISPSINDPGTAIRVCNLLGVILGRLGGVPAFDVGCLEDGRPRLFYPQLGTERLLVEMLGPLRTYGNHDPLVIVALLRCLKNAAHGEQSAAQLQALHAEISALRSDADSNLRNPRDRRVVNESLQRLNELGPRLPPVRLLSPEPEH